MFPFIMAKILMTSRTVNYRCASVHEPVYIAGTEIICMDGEESLVEKSVTIKLFDGRNAAAIFHAPLRS